MGRTETVRRSGAHRPSYLCRKFMQMQLVAGAVGSWSPIALLTLTFMGQIELDDIILSFPMIRLIISECRDPLGLRHSILTEVSIHRWVTVESG